MAGIFTRLFSLKLISQSPFMVETDMESKTLAFLPYKANLWNQNKKGATVSVAPFLFMNGISI